MSMSKQSRTAEKKRAPERAEVGRAMKGCEILVEALERRLVQGEHVEQVAGDRGAVAVAGEVARDDRHVDERVHVLVSVPQPTSAAT